MIRRYSYDVIHTTLFIRRCYRPLLFRQTRFDDGFVKMGFVKLGSNHSYGHNHTELFIRRYSCGVIHADLFIDRSYGLGHAELLMDAVKSFYTIHSTLFILHYSFYTVHTGSNYTIHSTLLGFTSYNSKKCDFVKPSLTKKLFQKKFFFRHVRIGRFINDYWW